MSSSTHRMASPPHPLPAERCKGQPRKGVGEDGARQPYCHTMSVFPLFRRGKCCPFLLFCVSVSGSVFFAFFSVLFLGCSLKKISGANFGFWVLVLALCFLVFCLGFGVVFWRLAPESVWKNFPDVRSAVLVFVLSSLGFSPTSFSFWFVFERQRSGSNRTPPHALVFVCFFSLFVPPRWVYRHFWPCVLLFGVFLGVPFWAPRVFGILLELTGLEFARPFLGPFSWDARRQGCFCASLAWFFLFPFCFVLRPHFFLKTRVGDLTEVGKRGSPQPLARVRARGSTSSAGAIWRQI